MTDKEEIIVWRGEKIDVGLIRDHLQRLRNKNGSPCFSPEEIERRVKYQVLEKKKWIGRLTGAKHSKYGGYRLAFYQKERQLFPEAYNVKVSDANAKKIVRKLFSHFGKNYSAKNTSVRFYGNRQSGSNGWGIRLSHNPSIALICHEVGHSFEHKHNKKLMKFMKKAINYCRKMNYWKMTLK